MTANSVHIRPKLHGRLPGQLFAFGRFLPHGIIVFTGGAIIVVITIFKFYDTGLHPEAGICSFGFLIGLNHPDLPPHHRPDFLL